MILKHGRVIPKDPFADAVKEVQDNLTLKSLEETFVFEITYDGKRPQLAADVANRMAKTFIDFMEQIRLSRAQFICDRMRPGSIKAGWIT